MPRTGWQTAPVLSIEVENPKSCYLPGDQIKGIVTYKRPEKGPAGTTLSMSLFGRSKSKYTVKRQHHKDTHRGRANLFDIRAQVKIVLSEGQDSETIPFDFRIPEHSMPGMHVRGDVFEARIDPRGGFLNTQEPTAKKEQELDVTQHPLPAVMYYMGESTMSGKTVEAYIEYALIAVCASGRSTVPLYVRTKSTEFPIPNFQMKSVNYPRLIQTLRLLPQYADGSSIPMGKKMSATFKSSKTPKYTYQARVTHPRVIQLEHPRPFPLSICIIPEPDPTKTTIDWRKDASLLPPVQMAAIKLKLDSYLDVRCPGTWTDHGTDKHNTFPFLFPEKLVPAVTIPVVIPESEHESGPTPAGSQSQELDLGSHFAMYLGHSARSTLGNRAVSFKRNIYPTFRTYNIALRYELEWSFRLTCAGEDHHVTGSSAIRVLPPSEEQELLKERKLGTQGMKKNWDGVFENAGEGLEVIADVLQQVLS